ncbi:MAG: DUF805 domain-containing protein [Pseudomonadota bacterium]
MGMLEAVRTGLRKWITFSGRASRAEYWWFYLGNILMMVGLAGAASLVLFAMGERAPLLLRWSVLCLLGLGLLWLYVAQISVIVRRLHDRNLSGFWLLGYLGLAMLGGLSGLFSTTIIMGLSGLTLVSSVLLLVVVAIRGTKGANRYGPDPLIQERPEAVFE